MIYLLNYINLKYYGISLCLLHNINNSLLGHNGAGKTTTVDSILLILNRLIV